MTEPFNPLDKKNLGVSVATALLEQEVSPIGNIKKFSGAGIYVTYYCGPFNAYREISAKNLNGNFQAPIYVGKAVPSGARKGKVSASTASTALCKRLSEHAATISEAENLAVKDFFCRYLVVDDIWIPLGESLLINNYSPIWNQLIDGFGNHTPGNGRFNQMRSRWDVLHPGRSWAMRCKERPETQRQLEEEVKNHLQNIAASGDQLHFE